MEAHASVTFRDSSESEKNCVLKEKNVFTFSLYSNSLCHPPESLQLPLPEQKEAVKVSRQCFYIYHICIQETRGFYDFISTFDF